MCVDVHRVPAIALQVHQSFFVFVWEEEGGPASLQVLTNARFAISVLNTVFNVSLS